MDRMLDTLLTEQNVMAYVNCHHLKGIFWDSEETKFGKEVETFYRMLFNDWNSGNYGYIWEISSKTFWPFPEYSLTFTVNTIIKSEIWFGRRTEQDWITAYHSGNLFKEKSDFTLVDFENLRKGHHTGFLRGHLNEIYTKPIK